MRSPVSLIFTVRNEAETIRMLLDSILAQTVTPNEIVVVDGGSTDQTTAIIEEYRALLPIKLVVSQGCNIAKGRNLAIQNSSYDIIACTDGGCKLDPKWLEKITMPFARSDVSVVSGGYAPWCESGFEEIIANMTFPDLSKLNASSFLPSSRSIAFRKEAWNDVNGYPEWLDTGEDTLFDLNLRNSGKRFALAADAIAFWKMRKNIRQVYKQYYRYGHGDGRAKLFPKVYLAKYAIIGLAAIATFLYRADLLLAIIPFSLVGLGIVAKDVMKLKRKTLSALISSFGIAAVIEIAPMLGFFRGYLSRFRMEPKQLPSLIKHYN